MLKRITNSLIIALLLITLISFFSNPSNKDFEEFVSYNTIDEKGIDGYKCNRTKNYFVLSLFEHKPHYSELWLKPRKYLGCFNNFYLLPLSIDNDSIYNTYLKEKDSIDFSIGYIVGEAVVDSAAAIVDSAAAAY
jgi:hypothetical protein